MKADARRELLSTRPRAIVLVTAHWKEDVPTISSAERHDLLFDYYGFPAETYGYKYSASGSPPVAERVFALLPSAGLKPRMDAMRGWDHGVFVPMMLMVPEANVPIVQLSVCQSQNAETHLRMGEALAPLRDENIAIVGSSTTFHNMAELRGAMGLRFDGDGRKAPNVAFDDKLAEASHIADAATRRSASASWRERPQAEPSHPMHREEHLMPVLVVAAAGLRALMGTFAGSFRLWSFQLSN
jgi:aromatic ring-opening dioxygenase catalytic subunit (LigB family)